LTENVSPPPSKQQQRSQVPEFVPDKSLDNAVSLLKDQGNQLAAVIADQQRIRAQSRKEFDAYKLQEELQQVAQNVIAARMASRAEAGLNDPTAEYEKDVQDLIAMRDVVEKMQADVKNINTKCDELVRSMPPPPPPGEYVDSLPPTPVPPHMLHAQHRNSYGTAPTYGMGSSGQPTPTSRDGGPLLSPKGVGVPPCSRFEPHYFKPEFCAVCKRSRLNHEGQKPALPPPQQRSSSPPVAQPTAAKKEPQNQPLSEQWQRALGSVLGQRSASKSPPAAPQSVPQPPVVPSLPPPPSTIVPTHRVPTVPTMRVINLDGGHTTLPVAVPLAAGTSPGYALPCALPIRVTDDITNAAKWHQQRSQSVDVSEDDDAIEEANAYRDILVDFYKQHNPRKVPQVDWILQQFKGEEAQLLILLALKYNVPVPPLPSRAGLLLL
jgi:hypothetical protein